MERIFGPRPTCKAQSRRCGCGATALPRPTTRHGGWSGGVLDLLDSGAARVAEPAAGGWVVHQWLKQAVLLSFRLRESAPMPGPGGAAAFDKVALKTAGWDAARFTAAGFRLVPGAVVRRSAYIAPGVVVMPSFINVGAHIGHGSMIDTWATVGSCAQIGRNCHISGGGGHRRRAGAAAGGTGDHRG